MTEKTRNYLIESIKEERDDLKAMKPSDLEGIMAGLYCLIWDYMHLLLTDPHKEVLDHWDDTTRERLGLER